MEVPMISLVDSSAWSWPDGRAKSRTHLEVDIKMLDVITVHVIPEGEAERRAVGGLTEHGRQASLVTQDLRGGGLDEDIMAWGMNNNMIISIILE